jgi:hypothetical protein
VKIIFISGWKRRRCASREARFVLHVFGLRLIAAHQKTNKEKTNDNSSVPQTDYLSHGVVLLYIECRKMPRGVQPRHF